MHDLENDGPNTGDGKCRTKSFSCSYMYVLFCAAKKVIDETTNNERD